MPRKSFLSLLAIAAYSTSGCATVAVLEAAQETEVHLTRAQSELKKSSEHFCEIAREAEWADGESSFAKIARLWDGEDDVGDDYWEELTDDVDTAAVLVDRISLDIQLASGALREVNRVATNLTAVTEAGDKPRKSDVADYERVLIHAGQARATFAEALLRASNEYDELALSDLRALLDPLDADLEEARRIADNLAAARMSGAIASLQSPTS